MKIPGEIKLELFCILTGIQTNKRIGLRPDRTIAKVDLTRHLPQH